MFLRCLFFKLLLFLFLFFLCMCVYAVLLPRRFRLTLFGGSPGFEGFALFRAFLPNRIPHPRPMACINTTVFGVISEDSPSRQTGLLESCVVISVLCLLFNSDSVFHVFVKRDKRQDLGGW